MTGAPVLEVQEFDKIVCSRVWCVTCRNKGVVLSQKGGLMELFGEKLLCYAMVFFYTDMVIHH